MIDELQEKVCWRWLSPCEARRQTFVDIIGSSNHSEWNDETMAAWLHTQKCNKQECHSLTVCTDKDSY